MRITRAVLRMKTLASLVVIAAGLSFLLVNTYSFGQNSATLEEAPPYPQPDPALKADILLIVAHPDDETMSSAYLARAMDEHKRVAILWFTCGVSGHDQTGPAMENALCLKREIEARNAATSLGVKNIFIMGAPDTPSANPLWSLERWNEGKALDYAVRVIRLTRPEVIISMLPDIMTGENHGDHQAAGIMATDAFDLAGNPNWFPEQVSFPTSVPYSTMNTEGLQPWQPEKLYFESNPRDPGWRKGQGPSYSTTDISPTRHIPYYRIAAEALAQHRSQVGPFVEKALASGNLSRFEHPIQFIFGKSLVGGSVTGDIFQNVVPGPIPYVRNRGYQPPTEQGIKISLGDPLNFYHRWWPAHGLERLAQLMPTPEMSVVPGMTLGVPLLIHNYTDAPAEVKLSVNLPAGWTEVAGPSFTHRPAGWKQLGGPAASYPVSAHGAYPIRVVLQAPASEKIGDWRQLTWTATSAGQPASAVTVKILLESHPSMPQ